jgi:hypothetical protein
MLTTLAAYHRSRRNSPVQHDVFDQGFSYPGQTYQNYLAAVGTRRRNYRLYSNPRQNWTLPRSMAFN